MICRKCHQEVADGAFCCLCGARQAAAEKAVKRRGNGQGTAYKRGKTWTAQVTDYFYDVDGVKHRKYKTKGGFPTKKEAIAYIEQLRQDKRCAPTLKQLYEQYEKAELSKVSNTRKKAYDLAKRRIEPFFPKRIDAITVSQLQQLVDSNANSYYTANDMKIVLSAIYKRAMMDQYVTTNLSQFISLPDKNAKESRPFTKAEVQTMWDAYANGNQFVGYILLMIYSGMMPGELLSCKKDMVDLERCEIYGCGKKTNVRKDNAIVFADAVRPVVEKIVQETDGDLLYSKGKKEFYSEYHKTMKKLGVRDLPPYSCRHTTGTEAARLNLNAATIQKIMRHGKISTSQQYIHLGTDDVHAAINKL